MTPKRVQRSRARGARLPEGAVYVGRPTMWGNPFRVGEEDPDGTLVRDNGHAVRLYAEYLTANPQLVADAREFLGGRDLVCWCALNETCHADLLLRVANRAIAEDCDLAANGRARRPGPSAAVVSMNLN